MANVDNPHGFRVIGHMFGVSPEVESMSKDASEGTALFINDLIVQETDGNIAKGAASAALSGVNLNHGAASTLTTHLIVCDPWVIGEMQDNSATDGFAAADAGGNLDAEFNAGSATTKISGHELGEASFSTTNTLQFHLRRLYNYADASGANAYGGWGRWEVSFNNHRRTTGVVGLA